MIPASGAGGPGFDSLLSPDVCHLALAKLHPWQDSNLQPPDPWSGALPLSHTDSCMVCGWGAPAGSGRGEKVMGDTVQVGPSAGWGPLLSSAFQELSVARPLSCSVSGLARFSLPQAPSRPDLRLASSGHTRVTRAEHRHSAVQHWSPMEPTHSASPLSPQEAGVSERCPPAPDVLVTYLTRAQSLCPERQRSSVRIRVGVCL